MGLVLEEEEPEETGGGDGDGGGGRPPDPEDDGDGDGGGYVSEQPKVIPVAATQALPLCIIHADGATWHGEVVEPRGA